MTRPDPRAEELDAALTSLRRISAVVTAGRHEFEESADRQLALESLWVNVGRLLKQYCRGLGIPAGTEPFAGPIRMRDKLVYGSLDDLRPDIIWETCVSDEPLLSTLLADLRAAI